MKMTVTEYCTRQTCNRRYLQRILVDPKKKELLKEKYGITDVAQVGRTHLLTVKNGFNFNNEHITNDKNK